MRQADFVHLHNHSEYSLLDSTCRVSNLIDAAHKFRMPALAITDHNNMFGAIEFYKEAKQHDIKPIIGCEITVLASDKAGRDPTTDSYHLVLLASNENGYRNLMELVSRSYMEGFHDVPFIDTSLLDELHEGLIALSACAKGQISRLLLAGKTDQARGWAGEFREIFGKGNFYLELQDHGLPDERLVMPQIIKLASDLEMSLVATNNCHYIAQEDSEAYKVLLGIKAKRNIPYLDGIEFGSDQFYFRSPAEMKALFPDHPEAISNSLAIAEKCNLELSFGKEVIPDYEVPPGENPDSFMEFLAWEGILDRYPDVSQEVKDRLQYELNTIKETGFATFFLIAKDIVDFARDNGISVGPGRGSAPGSIVSYCLGVTQIDPLKHGLLFERFLNLDRLVPPDFDIDFSLERRNEVFEHIFNKYGSENAARIISFTRMRARNVIREVGNVLEIPGHEIDRIASTIPVRPGRTLEGITEDVEYVHLFRIARALEGLPISVSVHPVGVAIVADKLTQYTPLYRTDRENIITQYDMSCLEDIGVNKFDILNIDAIDTIDRAVELIEEKHNVKVELNNLPTDDEATYDLICSGDTQDIFQYGGQGIIDLIMKLQPRSFEELIPIGPLYRPGPMNSGMLDRYMERKLDKARIEYAHPALKPILENTYGTIIYQEQAMRIGQEIAGFTPGRTDMLRRAMVKKKMAEVAKERAAFILGAADRNISEEVAELILEQMMQCAGYCFNRAHSVSYAMLTYWTAYLKAHYSEEFADAQETSKENLYR